MTSNADQPSKLRLSVTAYVERWPVKGTFIISIHGIIERNGVELFFHNVSLSGFRPENGVRQPWFDSYSVPRPEEKNK